MSDEPKREAKDGPVEVGRWMVNEEGVWIDKGIRLMATTNGEPQVILCSEWNARRLLGMLSVILGMPLSKAAAKKIEL